jgi:mono/diheme cytochrome c family protein
MIMPSEIFYALSDEDAGDMVAYLKTIEPVDNELPPTEIKLMGRIMAGLDESLASSASLVPEGPRSAMPERGSTAEYGEYRVRTFCVACHGDDLSGAQPPDSASPFAPSLIPYADFGLESFITAIRSGVASDGRQLDPKVMPWPSSGRMTDQDTEAIFLYIRRLAGK